MTLRLAGGLLRSLPAAARRAAPALAVTPQPPPPPAPPRRRRTRVCTTTAVGRHRTRRHTHSATRPPLPCMLCKPPPRAAAHDLPTKLPAVVPDRDAPVVSADDLPDDCTAVRPAFPAAATLSAGVAVAALAEDGDEHHHGRDDDPSLPDVMDFDTDANHEPRREGELDCDHAPTTVTTTGAMTTATTATTSTNTATAPSSPPTTSQDAADMHPEPPQPAQHQHPPQPQHLPSPSSSPSPSPSQLPVTKDPFNPAPAPVPALSTSTVTSSDASSSLTESSTHSKATTDEQKHLVADTTLTFRTGVVCIPHPEKADKGGEDAFFIQNRALGVFDGVGGWASIGVDAGLYSKELARLTANYVVNEGPSAVVDALKSATDNNRAIGSSTACVVGLDGAQLVGVNVGDSGLIVIRDGAIVYRTTEQQHYFNCPYQIGTDSLDTVEVGGPIDMKLQHGDWVVMGTDGLWDNVFPGVIVDIVQSHAGGVTDAGEGRKQTAGAGDNSSDGGSAASDCSASGAAVDEAQTIAQKLAECAVKVANDERGSSPFAVNAQNAGHLFLGGKVDDITIIAAVVVDPDVECYARKAGAVEEARSGVVAARKE